MSAPDPMEILRGIARAEREALPTPRAADEVVRDVQRAVGRRRRRRRIGLAAAIAALFATGGGVAWAIIHREHAPDPTQISCHQEPSLESSQIEVPADGSDPVDLCREAWTRFQPDWGPPPPMVACVGTTVIAHVFPGTDATCAELGMSPLEKGYTHAETDLIEFKDHLIAAIVAYGCASPDEATAIIEAELSRAGLVDWSIARLGTFDANFPCSALAIDVSSKSVTILPLPDNLAGDEGG